MVLSHCKIHCDVLVHSHLLWAAEVWRHFSWKGVRLKLQPAPMGSEKLGWILHIMSTCLQIVHQWCSLLFFSGSDLLSLRPMLLWRLRRDSLSWRKSRREISYRACKGPSAAELDLLIWDQCRNADTMTWEREKHGYVTGFDLLPHLIE